MPNVPHSPEGVPLIWSAETCLVQGQEHVLQVVNPWVHNKLKDLKLKIDIISVLNYLYIAFIFYNE